MQSGRAITHHQNRTRSHGSFRSNPRGLWNKSKRRIPEWYNRAPWNQRASSSWNPKPATSRDKDPLPIVVRLPQVSISRNVLENAVSGEISKGVRVRLVLIYFWYFVGVRVGVAVQIVLPLAVPGIRGFRRDLMGQSVAGRVVRRQCKRVSLAHGDLLRSAEKVDLSLKDGNLRSVVTRSHPEVRGAGYLESAAAGKQNEMVAGAEVKIEIDNSGLYLYRRKLASRIGY